MLLHVAANMEDINVVDALQKILHVEFVKPEWDVERSILGGKMRGTEERDDDVRSTTY